MKSRDGSFFIAVSKQLFSPQIIRFQHTVSSVLIVSGIFKSSGSRLIVFCSQRFSRLFIPAVRILFLTILISSQGVISRCRIFPLLFLSKCFSFVVKLGNQVFRTLGAVQKQRIGIIHLPCFGQIVIIPLINKVLIIATNIIGNPHRTILIIAKAFQPGKAVFVIAAFRQRQRFTIHRQGSSVLIAAQTFKLFRRFFILSFGQQILSGFVGSFRAAAGAEQEKGNKKNNKQDYFFLFHKFASLYSSLTLCF